jgi:hypothetical protein
MNCPPSQHIPTIGFSESDALAIDGQQTVEPAVKAVGPLLL